MNFQHKYKSSLKILYYVIFPTNYTGWKLEDMISLTKCFKNIINQSGCTE